MGILVVLLHIVLCLLHKLVSLKVNLAKFKQFHQQMRLEREPYRYHIRKIQQLPLFPLVQTLLLDRKAHDGRVDLAQRDDRRRVAVLRPFPKQQLIQAADRLGVNELVDLRLHDEHL